MEGMRLSVMNKFQRYLFPTRASQYAPEGESDEDESAAAAAATAESNFRQRLFEKISPYKQVSTHEDDMCRRTGGRATSRTRLTIKQMCIALMLG